MVSTCPAEAVPPSKAEFKNQAKGKKGRRRPSNTVVKMGWMVLVPAPKALSLIACLLFSNLDNRIQKKPLKHEQCTMFYLQLEE